MTTQRKAFQRSTTLVNFRRNALALSISMAMTGGAFANPSGLSVVSGQATVQHLGDVMKITNTPGAILNWNQFSIGKGETVQFLQQNAASEVFNRVTGGDMSVIMGTLQSNAQVYLFNTAGVFIGQGAVIDTAGFLASSVGASDSDLLKRHLKFGGDGAVAGSVINRGNIRAHSGGSVVLIAPSVENSGLIHADGEVLLAGGHSVTVLDLNNPTVGLTVSAKEGESAVNLGEVIGKNVSFFSSLVKNSGVVEATNVSVGKGGVIKFSGKQVEVLAGSRIQADGQNGGGTVQIGGGWQGKDAGMQNSMFTRIEAGATISADALGHGDGGEVAIWSDGTTRVDSVIQAKGGALSGNGGRVETSGKQRLSVSAAANTSAPKGKSGLWLLDPYNLRVVQAGSVLLDPDKAVVNNGNVPNATYVPIDQNPEGADSFLSNAVLRDAFNSNSSVVLKTTGGTGGSGVGNISIEAPVILGSFGACGSFGATASLYLEAEGGISILAPVGLDSNLGGSGAYSNFNLKLGYDISKPVLIDAPLYLGSSGELLLAPYKRTEAGGAASGVTFGVGYNYFDDSNGPTGREYFAQNLNRMKVVNSPLQGNEGYYPLGADDAVNVSIVGANLRVRNIDAEGMSGSEQPINLDIQIARDSESMSDGFLRTDSVLNTRSVNVNAGGRFIHQSQVENSIDQFKVGTLNVNSGGELSLSGNFRTEDINAINFAQGKLSLGGRLDNTTATGSLLAQNNIHVVNNLVVVGGVISSGQTGNRLILSPSSFLELQRTRLQAGLKMELGSVLLLADRDSSGAEISPNTLEGTTISMEGNNFVIVGARLLTDPGTESFQAVATLTGDAIFESGKQGNIIVAAVQLFGDEPTPSQLNLNVGTGIRLNVTGNVQTTTLVSAENGFQNGNFQASEIGFDRPVFSVGVRPDGLVPPCFQSETCGGLEFGGDQAGAFNGMVMSSLNTDAPTLANSGVVFSQFINLAGLQFASSTADEIRFLDGVNEIKAADLISKKKLINQATIVFTSNTTNESIATDLENFGTLQFDGAYTLTGLISGNGSIQNSGNLTLSNVNNSRFGNSLVNFGTLNNVGNYVFDGNLTGPGTFNNSGVFAFTNPGLVTNAISNNPGGVFILQGSAGQSYSFSQGFVNGGVFQSNGALLGFSQGFTQSGGFSNFAPGTIVSGNTTINGGLFTGFGTFNGNVNVASGRVVPGASPGAMVVNGNLNLSPTSVLDIEIQSAGTPGSAYDYVVVNGTANLDGQLNLIDISNQGAGGALPVGEQFGFLQASTIAGGFSSVTTVHPSASYAFSTPTVLTTPNGSLLSTSTIASGAAVIGGGSTGTTDSTVSQNLNQAFTQIPTVTTLTASPTTNTSGPAPRQAEEERVAQAASQGVAGTTISQQTNDIELRSVPSDPQRPGAVCK